MTLLASLADYHAARGDTYDPTDLAAVIALEAASAVVRTYTGQDFDYVGDDIITLDGTGMPHLLLPQLPVVSIGTIEEDGVELEPVTPATDVAIERHGVLYRTDTCRWYAGLANYRITYSHGYTLPGDTGPAPALPADVQLVCMNLAGRLAEDVTTAGGQLVQARTIGSYSESYQQQAASAAAATYESLNHLEREVLDRYRVPQ
jgi:hypothetical protein